MSTEPAGILGFLNAANEIQNERGCTFGEALEIWKESVAVVDEQPEPETNVIYGIDFVGKVRS